MPKITQKLLPAFHVFRVSFSLLGLVCTQAALAGILYGDRVPENRQGISVPAATLPSTVTVRRNLTTTESLRSEALDGLEEMVVAHFEAISIERLANFLAPKGWEVHFDLPGSLAQQTVVFHAETTREKALDTMLKGLNLKGTIYSQRGIVFISGGKW